MHLSDLIFLSFGLAMDAFAVSVTDGMSDRKVNFIKALFISLTFGIFQGVMPSLGYMISQSFLSFITDYGHITALILLSGIGIKMIVETLKCGDESNRECYGISFGMVMVQGLATSIDALAVGVSFSAVNMNIVTSCAVIAVVTFICCMLGVFTGKKFGNILNNKAQIIGGIVLVIIGLKIFMEHYL